MQEYESLVNKINFIDWQEKKAVLAGELLLIVHLVYAVGSSFWHRFENVLGVRIYLGILICDCIVLLGILAACCVRTVTQKESEGIFIRGVKFCLLLLLIFGVLGFLNTLILF